MSIKPDETNVAIWSRFRPYRENAEDWQSYKSFRAPFTDNLSKRLRFLTLASIVRQIKVPGAFAECGSCGGHSTHVIARSMKLCGRNSPLYVFDSFEGLSPASPEDLATDTEDIHGFQKGLRDGKRMFASSLEQTVSNLSEHKNIFYYPGWIPSRFPEIAELTFAFVHIDVDLYSPTKDSLEFFFPRLERGGMIQIDDYNFVDWPGATKAVDDFLATVDVQFFLPHPLGGALLIK
jgi:O-methyltransferase